MLMRKVGSGKKYLYKIDSVEYVDNGNGWKSAYVLDDKGYFFTSPDRVVEVEETEVEKMFPTLIESRWYKWKL